MNGTTGTQTLEWLGEDGEAHAPGSALDVEVALQRSRQESAALRADRELLERSVARLARRVATLERALRESQPRENVLTDVPGGQRLFRTQ